MFKSNKKNPNDLRGQYNDPTRDALDYVVPFGTIAAGVTSMGLGSSVAEKFGYAVQRDVGKFGNALSKISPNPGQTNMKTRKIQNKITGMTGGAKALGGIAGLGLAGYGAYKLKGVHDRIQAAKERQKLRYGRV